MPGAESRTRSIEKELRSRIQTEAMRRMQLLSDSDLVRTLDLLPIGVEVLKQRQTWSLDEAIRVAEQLGIEVKLEVVSDDESG